MGVRRFSPRKFEKWPKITAFLIIIYRPISANEKSIDLLDDEQGIWWRGSGFYPEKYFVVEKMVQHN